MVMRASIISALSTALSLLGVIPCLGSEPPDRQIVLTFDDLPAQRAQSQPPERVTEIIDGLLRSLVKQRPFGGEQALSPSEGGQTQSPSGGGQAQNIPAIGFVNENKLEVDGALDPFRVKLLERWLDAGLALGNHSYSHPDLHRTPLADYQRDVLRGEAVTRRLIETRGGKPRYFRHPFLHTGRDLEIKHEFERFLAGLGYKVAPVTIDNSEWIFARAYTETLDRGDQGLQKKTAEAYLEYMERMVEYYEGQSRALFRREIPQILLLHANALNAHYLDALTAMLRRRGYRFIDLDTALRDPVYESPDTYVGPAGLTWLHRWAITRGVDRTVFQGEPTTPRWIQELAALKEAARGPRG